MKKNKDRNKEKSKRSVTYPYAKFQGETFVEKKSSIAVKSDEKLLSLLESTQDFVYMVNGNRKIVLAFGKCLPHIKMATDDIIGLNYEILCSSESVLIHRIAHENAFNGEAVTYEWFCETSKDINYYKTALMPIFGNNNKVISIVASVRSVSRRIKTRAANMIADKGIKSFSQILLTIREEEKKKISVALHDELGSLAVAVSSMLGILEADIKDKQIKGALSGLVNIKGYIEDFLGKMKQIAVSLRPLNLDTVGLSGALKDLIALISKHSDIDVKLKNKIPENIKVDDNVRTALYRVVQESLNNILKHSNAKNARILLENKEDRIRLSVTDDGKGFKFDKNRNIRLKNIGILGMKESIELLGGTFNLKSKIGEGTVLTVVCPLASYVVGI